MRFYAVNLTGTTVHLRLDHGSKQNEYVLTVTQRKIASRLTPAGEYIAVTKNPVHIPRLVEHVTFTVHNPDKLKLHLFVDHEKDYILRIEGFIN